jgi:DNA-binding beta-propeller fold protein YncE
LAGAVARLDGDSTGVQVVTASDRVMTVTMLASRLQAGGPRRYALDVTSGGTVSNAASFVVVQSVDVTGTGCAAPAPLGVAIDPQHNLAVVSNSGCGNVSLINLTTGTGQYVAVGTNPVGIGILPQSALAVVANSGSNTASVVDLIGGTVVATVNTDIAPTGVAVDPLLGVAVVSATLANVVDVFPVSTTPGVVTSIAVQQRPVAVAIDPVRHLAAVGNTSSNTVSLVDLVANTSATAINVNSPAGIAFDPFTRTFLAASSLTNQVLVLDPATQTSTTIRVGINPTSIANNFASSTMVTTNNLSKSMTVVDFLERRVRAVLPVNPSNAFSIDIHPFTNTAVIADSTNHRVLLFPLPR